MQRFLKWLGTLVFGAPETAPKKVHTRATNSRLRAVQTRRRVAAHAEARLHDSGSFRVEEFDADTELGSRDGAGPAIPRAQRTRYVREESGTYEMLKILDANLVDSGDRGGFDPYNTGKFDRSANWSRHTRK